MTVSCTTRRSRCCSRRAALRPFAPRPRRHAFGFDDVAARGQQPRRAAVQGAASTLPPELRDLDYDAYRDIRFRPDKALWRSREAAVRADVLPPGPRRCRSRCGSTSSSRAGVRAVAFDPALFDYGQQQVRSAEAARPRLRRLSRPLRDQQARLQGRGPRLPGRELLPRRSARARSTACRRAASPSTPPRPSGEEFPRFVEFWIERPRAARDLADDLRAARLAPRRRRLPLRAHARRRDGDAGDARGSSRARRSPSSASRR